MVDRLRGADHAGPHPRPSRPGHDRHVVAADDLLRRGRRTDRARPPGPRPVARRRVRQHVRADRDHRRLHQPLPGRPPRPAPHRLGRPGPARGRGPRRRPRHRRRRSGPTPSARSGCARRRWCRPRAPTWTTAGCTRGDLARMDADGYLYPAGPHVRHHQPGRREVPAVRDRRPAAGPPGGGRRGRSPACPTPSSASGSAWPSWCAPGSPAPTRDELRDWCRADLAGFKLPDVVVVVDALPVNELGKLPRAAAVELIIGARPRPSGTP